MHINNNLYSGEIIREPWAHLCVEDFFTEKTWVKLSQIPKYILSKTPNDNLKKCISSAKKNHHGGWVLGITDLLDVGIPEDIVECYWDACKELYENREKIWDQFPKHKSPSSRTLLMKPCLNMDFKGNWFEPHPDTRAKVISFVCYLDPEEDEGTSLHINETYGSIKKTVDWKPNRCLVFCPTDDTWHSFRCRNTHRLVLAMFLENNFIRDKKFKHTHTFSSGKIAEFWCNYD